MASEKQIRIEEKLQATKAELQASKQRETGYKNANESLYDQMCELAKRVTELENMISTKAQAGIMSMNAMIQLVEHLRNEKLRIEEELRILKTDRNPTPDNTELLSLREQVSALTESNKESVRDLSSDLESMKTEYNALLQEYEGVKLELMDLTERNGVLEEETKELETKRAMLEYEAARDKQSLTDIRKHMDEVSAANDQLQELRDKMSQLTAEHDSLSSENGDVKSRLIDLQDAYNELELSKNQQSKILQQARQLARNYKSKSVTLETTVAELNSKLEKKGREESPNYSFSSPPRSLYCKLCGDKDHSARDCPEKAGRTPMTPCPVCKENGHWSSDCPARRNQGFICYKCHKQGHMARDCPENTEDVGDSGRTASVGDIGAAGGQVGGGFGGIY